MSSEYRADHPLRGAFAKIARANQHLSELEAEIAASGDTDAVRLVQQFHPDVSTIEITVQGVPELPIEWALITADAIQNLRTALNYVAWELARWNLSNTRDPVDATQFPINSKARRFSERYLADLHCDHVERIKRLQPNGPDWLSTFREGMLLQCTVEQLAAMHPLAVLAELSNEDKHRALRVAIVDWQHYSFRFYPRDCTIISQSLWPPEEFKNGATWATFQVSITGPNPKVDMDDKDPFRVQVIVGRYSVGWLREKVASTVLRTVRAFEPVF